MSCEPSAISAMMPFVCTPSACSTASQYTFTTSNSGPMLPGVDAIAKEAGKDHQEGASYMEGTMEVFSDVLRDSQRCCAAVARASRSGTGERPPYVYEIVRQYAEADPAPDSLHATVAAASQSVTAL